MAKKWRDLIEDIPEERRREIDRHAAVLLAEIDDFERLQRFALKGYKKGLDRRRITNKDGEEI